MTMTENADDQLASAELARTEDRGEEDVMSNGAYGKLVYTQPSPHIPQKNIEHVEFLQAADRGALCVAAQMRISALRDAGRLDTKAQEVMLVIFRSASPREGGEILRYQDIEREAGVVYVPQVFF